MKKILSKPAIMLLGIINQKPLNPYGIIKQLNLMNTKWWFYIANSTVYATIKKLEKSNYIQGQSEKQSNMPEKTIYSITIKGLEFLKESINFICDVFDYDTSLFSIAVSFINIFNLEERTILLQNRLCYLQEYYQGLQEMLPEYKKQFSFLVISNIKRMQEIVNAEIVGLKEILLALTSEKNNEKA